jgi:hypothetical protein
MQQGISVSTLVPVSSKYKTTASGVLGSKQQLDTLDQMKNNLSQA